jgi:hypothetical protein
MRRREIREVVWDKWVAHPAIAVRRIKGSWYQAAKRNVTRRRQANRIGPPQKVDLVRQAINFQTISIPFSELAARNVNTGGKDRSTLSSHSRTSEEGKKERSLRLRIYYYKQIKVPSQWICRGRWGKIGWQGMMGYPLNHAIRMQ